MAPFSRWKIPFNGWKSTAVYLTGLVTTLTTLLIVLLFVSLFHLEKDDADYGEGRNDQDSLGQSVLYRGNCKTSARANLWIHLAINIIGTGVLASSNFFMQSLVAPTRAEVDAAHKAGHWLEIGVQSLKNFRFLGWRKILFWSLFSLSSVPLHLVFNGCVLESKGTNGFMVLLGTKSLVQGSWRGEPPISDWYNDVYRPGAGSAEGAIAYAKPISESLTAKDSINRWQEIPLEVCMERYNKPEVALTRYRHVIFVMQDYEDFDGNLTQGWKRGEVLKNTTGISDLNVTTQLWGVSGYSRTGKTGYNSAISQPKSETWGRQRLDARQPANRMYIQGTTNVFDPISGVMVMDPEWYTSKYRVMQVSYCISESYEAPCRLSVANSLLLIVCIMCAFKCVLCFLVLKLRVWGDENPLMTPGDAIASFIARPDEETKGMCTLSSQDLKKNPNKKAPGLGDISQNYKWLQGPRQWQATSMRRFGKAVPVTIWVISSVLIGSSLIVAAVMLNMAIRGQPIEESRFGHAPQNEDVSNTDFEGLSLISLTMIANTPQLVLSICYLAYNGLFTRMLAEFEWSKYSVEFRALRVTEPKGKQNSTYRLQLPYRFSIPLIIVSILLHWIYSNCIYVSNYEAYAAGYPYARTVSVGLQFSSKAILIALCVTVCIATAPLILAYVKLPGIMVIAGGNSAVMSAACHYPSTKLQSLSRATSVYSRPGSEYDSMTIGLIGDEEVEELDNVARKKVKWGRISTGKSDESQVGHLGFGTEEFKIEKPVEGEHYSGL
ncbi:hypothetical protein QYS62_011168 [Fusarium acuminatum]|uniref:DUF6536 domain-containing protein n=1 Tax=Fusarium acuminatum TaxID=5515 RepID=A0ABZ2XD76_9HYPO